MCAYRDRPEQAAGERCVRRRPARSRSARRKRRFPLSLLLVGILLLGGNALLGSGSAIWDMELGEGQQSEVSEPAGGMDPGSETGQELAPPTVDTTQEDVDTEPDEDRSEEAAAEQDLRLVNRDHPLPEDLLAPELTYLRNGQAIDTRVYPDLQAMMDAARAEGYHPLICSSFRTWDKQEQLFERKVRSYQDQGYDREEAEEMAAVWVARPGTSEHQLGVAVDIVSEEYQILDEGQEDTPLQQWLMEHCWEYGFILRYPVGSQEITGVGYEPWHYRYVGKEAALAIRDQGVCLEEYLAQMEMDAAD